MSEPSAAPSHEPPPRDAYAGGGLTRPGKRLRRNDFLWLIFMISIAISLIISALLQ